jgi:hypothetical protein
MRSEPADGQRPSTWQRSRAARFLDTYFRTAPSPPLSQVDDSLWVGDASNEWTARDVNYRSTVLEQYKIYVEMADRVSARRAAANAFFLTLNTAIGTALGILWQHPPDTSRWQIVIPWLALLGQCLAWFWILRSYRQLNSAKYAVVGALEKRLPASPYWSAEWAALGKGRDSAQYWPLSHVESLIPAFYAGTYTAGFIALLVN